MLKDVHVHEVCKCLCVWSPCKSIHVWDSFIFIEVCRWQKLILGIFYSFIFYHPPNQFWRQDFSWSLELAILLDWLASECWEFKCLCPLVLQLQVHQSSHGMHAEPQNSDPHTCEMVTFSLQTSALLLDILQSIL